MSEDDPLLRFYREYAALRVKPVIVGIEREWFNAIYKHCRKSYTDRKLPKTPPEFYYLYGIKVHPVDEEAIPSCPEE